MCESVISGRIHLRPQSLCLGVLAVVLVLRAPASTRFARRSSYRHDMAARILGIATWQLPASWLVAIAVSACGGGDVDKSPSPSAFQIVLPPSSLVSLPRITASPDGTAWLAWVEGNDTQQSLLAARIDGGGGVRAATVSPNVTGSLQDQQIVMQGATPVLVWREYDQPEAVKVNVAAFVGGQWHQELSVAGSGSGALSVVRITAGGIALGWVRVDASNHFQLVAAERSPNGGWSAPSVVRTLPDGIVFISSDVGSDDGGALMALWSEAPDGSQSTVPQPQSLWSAQSGDAAATWSAPLVVDAGQFYVAPSVASTAPGRWLAAWLAGDSFALTALVDKRFDGTGWSAATERIDAGEDVELREMVMASAGHRIFVAWTGFGPDRQTSSLRASTLDTGSDTWLVPASIHTQIGGFPDVLRVAADSSGVAGLVCDVSQADALRPFLATTDASGRWKAGLETDLDAMGQGLAPSLSFFSSSDVVAAWYRIVPGGSSAIVVRRIR